MKTTKDIQNEIFSLETECKKLKLIKEELQEKISQVNTRIKDIEGNSHSSRINSAISHLNSELRKINQQEIDSKLPKCVLTNSNKNFIVTKIGYRNIFVREVGTNKQFSFNKNDGTTFAPNHTKVRLNVAKTIANFEANYDQTNDK